MVVCVCVQSASTSDYKGMPTGSQVTLGYNSARINEATGNFQAAATEYKNILEAFPGRKSLCSLGDCALAGIHVCSLCRLPVSVFRPELLRKT